MDIEKQWDHVLAGKPMGQHGEGGGGVNDGVDLEACTILPCAVSMVLESRQCSVNGHDALATVDTDIIKIIVCRDLITSNISVHNSQKRPYLDHFCNFSIRCLLIMHSLCWF